MTYYGKHPDGRFMTKSEAEALAGVNGFTGATVDGDGGSTGEDGADGATDGDSTDGDGQDGTDGDGAGFFSPVDPATVALQPDSVDNGDGDGDDSNDDGDGTTDDKKDKKAPRETKEQKRAKAELFARTAVSLTLEGFNTYLGFRLGSLPKGMQDALEKDNSVSEQERADLIMAVTDYAETQKIKLTPEQQLIFVLGTVFLPKIGQVEATMFFYNKDKKNKRKATPNDG